MWMTPFYLFLGTLLIYMFQKKVNFKKINTVLLYLFLILLCTYLHATYLYVSLYRVELKRTDYPGKEIATINSKEMGRIIFLMKLQLSVGDEWSGGNLSYHLNFKTKVDE